MIAFLFACSNEPAVMLSRDDHGQITGIDLSAPIIFLICFVVTALAQAVGNKKTS